jgi:hypothetical protein
MLGSIHAVTTTVPDLQPIEAAYSRYLGYRTVDKGAVSEATAMRWGAPAVAGCRFLIMMPESGAPAYLRFVETPAVDGWSALRTHGWNATELIIQDTDALAARLADSPFKIIGPPADLDGFPMIRAMQVLGPAGECLYLTRVGPGSGFDLPEAKSFVDRVFIVVIGTADLDVAMKFYAGLGSPAGEPGTSIVGVLSDANGLPRDTKFNLTMVSLVEGATVAGTLIEVDEYPASATPRPIPAGHLPPGMAMVTFGVPQLKDDDLIAPPGVADMEPFKGRYCGTLRGPWGELIELIEDTP